MKQHRITEKVIGMLGEHLRKEEKCRATVEKYVQDVGAQSDFQPYSSKS